MAARPGWPANSSISDGKRDRVELLWAGMGAPVTIDQLLEQARKQIDRLTPPEALGAQNAGALIVDIRPLEQRRRDGCISQALIVDRNVLEWRLSPTSQWRLKEASGRRLILLCNQGYQSSLAASTLRLLGLPRPADVIGGFQAWVAAGLPIIDQEDFRDGGPTTAA